MQISRAGHVQKNIKQDNTQNKQPAFKGCDKFLNAAAKPLQAMDANPILAVVLLDIVTAILPNYLIDTFQRNVAQGLETLRREASGLIINCLLPGAAVLGVAWGMKNAVMGKEFKDVPSHRVWASEDNITEGVATWKKAAGTTREEKIRNFVEHSFERIKPNDESLMVKGTPEEIEAAKKEAKTAIKDLADEIIQGNGTYSSNKKRMKIDDKKLNSIYERLSRAYGQSKGVEITRIADGAKPGSTFSTGMKNYIRDTFSLARAFEDNAVKTHGIDKYADKLKKLLKFKSYGTMAAVGALALSMQAINRKITEKSTGRKGYSGYKDLNNDSAPTERSDKEKKELFIGKMLATGASASIMAGMGTFAPGMLNFAAPTTTMHQGRSLYLLTDMGRVNASYEKNELKDTLIRDTLIFLNLYVLGDFVQKGIMEGVQKYYKKNKNVDLNLFNEGQKPAENASTFAKIKYWMRGKSVKTFTEIEGTMAKNATVQTRKNILTASTLMSLSYSIGALGIFAPIMIARMTNKNREKQIAEAKKRLATGTVGAATATVAASSIVDASKVSKSSKIKQATVRAPKLYTEAQS